MKFLWLLLCILLFQQNIFATVKTHPPAPDKILAKLTTTDIDQLNDLAYGTYLASPVYARKLAASSLLHSKIINYKKGIGQSSLNIGLTYWAQSYYSVSLLYIDTALRYLGKTDSLLISDCYRYIGRNYIDLRDYKSAAIFLDKAQKAAGADKDRHVGVLSEQTYLYLQLKQFDKAFTATNQSLKICRAIKDSSTLAVLYSRFINIYIAKNQPDNALSYCDTTIQLSYLVNNRRLRTNTYVYRSALLLSQKKSDDALYYAKQALSIGDSLGLKDAVANSYKAIINIYEAKGDKEQLLFYEKKFNTFYEERHDSDKVTRSQLMRDYFELNAQLQDINLMKQKAHNNSLRIKSQQEIISILFISLLFIAIAFYVVWFYYRQKTVLSKKLQDQNLATITQSQIIENQAHDLEELNNFKSKLLAIIGHDLRMPLANLSNLTELFEDGSFSVEEIHMLMKSLNPLVKSAELTLANLLAWADGQIRGVKGIQQTCVNLLQVIEEAKQICNYALVTKSIHIHHSADTHNLALVNENHLKVVFSNLISNAIKFTENSGNVTIDIDRQDDKIIVSIADTGVGMTQEEIEKLLSVSTHFSKPGTQGEKGTGIGFMLCRELIELNGGKLWLTSTVGQGTTFYFSLKAC